MVSLTYPWLIGLLVFAAVVLAVRKCFFICGIVIMMAITLNWYSECIAWNLSALDRDCRGRSLRVLTWNINSDYTDSKNELQKIASVVFDANPDVVFISEVMWMAADTMTQIMSEKYPYTTLVREERHLGHYIYSKYPLGGHHFIYGNEPNGKVIKAIVSIGGDSLCIYGCHLASNNYDGDSNYMTPDSIVNRSNAFKYLSNIERASKIRMEQCDSIVADMRAHEGACIVMGDMNDVCGSPYINVLEKAGMKDAWWQGGLGYGATYHHPLAFRIDHVVYSEGLRLKGIKKIDADGLSDHDALFADFCFE